MVYKEKVSTRFRSKVSGKAVYSNPRLIDNDGYYETSANPSDYFMQSDDFKFKNQDLVVTETKGEWQRVKVIKHNPSKSDLKELNKKLKTFI